MLWPVRPVKWSTFMFFEQLIPSILTDMNSTNTVSRILQMLSSKEAIISYAMIFLILIAVLVAFILNDTKKNSTEKITIISDLQNPSGFMREYAENGSSQDLCPM